MYLPKENINTLIKELGVEIFANNTFDCEEKKNMPDIIFNVGIMGGANTNIILKKEQYIETKIDETGGQPKEICQILTKMIG
uniref:DJ-1_PfpI domain-containing protein n=1 Tax=Meloidogyne hapla TaxID=6305 RepID=A0A1I8B4C9_MELHA